VRRRRLLVLAASPLLSLLVLEAGLRVAHDRCGGLKGWLYMAGETTRYDDAVTLPQLMAAAGCPVAPHAKSGDFVLNSRGLRTLEYDVAKAAGTRRIVVLGDSHTWASGGMPWRSLWHNRLAEALAGRCAEPVELISLGVPAVGTAFEARMWQVEGTRLDPDIVILAVSVGNDFLEVSGELADQTLLDRCARVSYVVRLARNAWRLNHACTDLAAPDPAPHDSALAPPEALALAAPSEPRDQAVQGRLPPKRARYDRTAPGFTVAEHERIVFGRCCISDTQPENTGKFARALELLSAIVQQLDADVRDHGARLVVLLIPDEYQVDDGMLEQVLSKRCRTIEDFDIGRPQRALRDLCVAHDILCVDALQAIRERACHEPMFNVRETHLNDLGHVVLAELTVEALLDAHLLD
jgi:hypothetical protein